MDRIVPGPLLFRGRTYRSPEEMPAPVRRAYERALWALDGTVPTGAPDAWEEAFLNHTPPSPAPEAGEDQG